MTIQPTVAGKFYPGKPEILRQTILDMLNTSSSKTKLPLPKAIIAPHAGYIYSGPIAASAYACLTNYSEQIKQVVIFSPAHRHSVNGIATTSAKSYLTPLGQIPIDQTALTQLSIPYLNIVEEAFTSEHAIEVHLPFLQSTLKNFSLIPLIVGSASIDEIQKLIEKLWNDSETLVVISSDLSHYHPYEAAQELDRKTAEAIVNLNPDGFSYSDACGATLIKALLSVAAEKKIHATQIDLRNSGDTEGSKDSVVGYGAFHFG